MLTVTEVKSNKDIKEFINFPLRLYKKCEFFVPPMYQDEKKLLKTGGNSETAESVFYIAKKDGKTVGRIQGIIQKQYNQMHSEKRVRFTRFDAIDDGEVARALFNAVEKWAQNNGMDTVCGPLGFSDLDREGLLIDGFNENSTFEEQYNYEYYSRLIENLGYEKEIDWVEFELKAPEKKNPMLKRVAERALELNKLHIADTNMSKKAYIEKYGDSFFDCLDECYSKIYGAVPITSEERKELISQFLLIININYAVFICDESERVVAFGLCFPAIGDALKKSGGRLTIPALIKLIKAAKNPKIIDLGLVAVRPEYQNAGINAVLINGIADMLAEGKIEKCETNLNLESNTAVIAQWKHFNSRQHKRRRSYIKTLKALV